MSTALRPQFGGEFITIGNRSAREKFDRFTLALERIDTLVAHLAARLEAVADEGGDVDECHALSYIAMTVHHHLIELSEQAALLVGTKGGA